MSMVRVGRKLFCGVDFYGNVRRALENGVNLALSDKNKLPESFTLDATVPVLGNSRRDSEKLSLVLWTFSPAPRIILRAFRVARSEFVYTGRASRVMSTIFTPSNEKR
jgi:hypothetical protein